MIWRKCRERPMYEIEENVPLCREARGKALAKTKAARATAEESLGTASEMKCNDYCNRRRRREAIKAMKKLEEKLSRKSRKPLIWRKCQRRRSYERSLRMKKAMKKMKALWLRQWKLSKKWRSLEMYKPHEKMSILMKYLNNVEEKIWRIPWREEKLWEMKWYLNEMWENVSHYHESSMSFLLIQIWNRSLLTCAEENIHLEKWNQYKSSPSAETKWERREAREGWPFRREMTVRS